MYFTCTPTDHWPFVNLWPAHVISDQLIYPKTCQYNQNKNVTTFHGLCYKTLQADHWTLLKQNTKYYLYVCICNAAYWFTGNVSFLNSKYVLTEKCRDKCKLRYLTLFNLGCRKVIYRKAFKLALEYSLASLFILAVTALTGCSILCSQPGIPWTVNGSFQNSKYRYHFKIKVKEAENKTNKSVWSKCLTLTNVSLILVGFTNVSKQ